MQAFAWIVRVVVVVFLVWFAVRNGQEVEIRGLPEQSWKAPLIFVMLVAFIGGLLIGLMAWLPTIVRQRRELARLRKAPPMPPVPMPPGPVPAATSARDGDGI